MPRATPVNARKKTALQFIVEANDRGRYVAGMLRRAKTDAFGKPVTLTKQDVDRCLSACDRARKSWELAEAHLRALRALVPNAD